MRKLVWTTVFLGILLCVKTSFAATAPIDFEKKRLDSLRAARLEKVAFFRQAYPGVELHPNPVTGVPEHLYGDLSKSQTKSDPVEAAYEFLEQHKDLYGISSPRDELKVQGVAKDQYGAMVDLKQVFKDVEIYQAGMSVHFTAAGKLKGITGGFAQISDLSVVPAIDSITTIGVVKRDLNYTAEDEQRLIRFEESLGKKNRSPSNAWLLIADFNGQYRLVWIVGVSRINPPELWEYWLDAHSGIILNKKPNRVLDQFAPKPALKPPVGNEPKNTGKIPVVPNSIEKNIMLQLDTMKWPRFG